MGQLLKIKFHGTHWTVCLGLGLYVRCDTSDRTLALRFLGKTSFFSTHPLILQINLKDYQMLPKVS